MVAFDTLKLSRKLESAGFTHEQAVGAAEALSEMMGDNVATKGDVEQAGNDLEQAISRVEGKLELTRNDLEQAISRVEGKLELTRNDLEQAISDVKTANKNSLDLAVSKLKGEIILVKWMLALVIVATVIPLIRDFL